MPNKGLLKQINRVLVSAKLFEKVIKSFNKGSERTEGQYLGLVYTNF